ncbi:MAG: hypothetical protein H7145_00005 [Akkermansiaceae bacterium]|nr:hypothetical protein [Armatimonadota bacterium]
MRNFFSMPPPDAPDSRETARLRTVLITVATSVIAALVFAGKPWSDGRTAALLCAINGTTFALHILWYRDGSIARLLLFGACLGIVELVADALCVRFTGTLDYSVANSRMIWESPWWMPLAWMLVGSQIGYLGARFIERVGLWRGAILSAIIGAINIPFYEEMARYAHWWEYQFCRMLPGTHTPVYIVVAELIIGLSLGPLARIALRKPSWRGAAIAGLLAGLATIIGGLVGFGAAEGLG